MPEITTRVCGVTFESTFKSAVLFKDTHCDVAAERCLEAFAGYGLRPTQIALRSGDQAFNYDLSFSLFNGNGTFRLSSEKLHVALQNATSEKDLEIVKDCVAKAYEHLPLSEIGSTQILANAHATFATDEAWQQYLRRFANPDRQIVSGGILAYVRCQNWAEEIRLSADHSLVFPSGLFLDWSTTYRAGKPTREVIGNVATVFEDAVSKFDLTFSKQASQ